MTIPALARSRSVLHVRVRFGGDVGVQVVAEFVSDFDRQFRGATSCLGFRRRQNAPLSSDLVCLTLDMHGSMQQVDVATLLAQQLTRSERTECCNRLAIGTETLTQSSALRASRDHPKNCQGRRTPSARLNWIAARREDRRKPSTTAAATSVRNASTRSSDAWQVSSSSSLMTRNQPRLGYAAKRRLVQSSMSRRYPEQYRVRETRENAGIGSTDQRRDGGTCRAIGECSVRERGNP